MRYTSITFNQKPDLHEYIDNRLLNRQRLLNEI